SITQSICSLLRARPSRLAAMTSTASNASTVTVSFLRRSCSGSRPVGGGRRGTGRLGGGPSVFGAVCVPGPTEVVGSERLGQDHGHRGPSAGHVEDEVVAAVFEQQLPAPAAGNERIAVAVHTVEGDEAAAAGHEQVGDQRAFGAECDAE